LKYYAKNPNTKREIVQELIWNLSNKTYYEDYPDNLKNLLNKIDSRTSNKIPSKLREKMIETGMSILEDVSGIDLRGIGELVQGRYYDYEKFRWNLEGLRFRLIIYAIALGAAQFILHGIGAVDRVAFEIGENLRREIHHDRFAFAQVGFVNHNVIVDVGREVLFPDRRIYK